MALQKKAMISDRTEGDQPRIEPKVTRTGVFAQAGSIKTLPVGTVVAFNSSTNGWVEWANGGANDTGEIRGVIYPDPVTITTAGEVAGVIMIEGDAHRDALVSDGGTSGQLDTALQTQARPRGIHVRGLVDVR